MSNLFTKALDERDAKIDAENHKILRAIDTLADEVTAVVLSHMTAFDIADAKVFVGQHALICSVVGMSKAYGIPRSDLVGAILNEFDTMEKTLAEAEAEAA